MSGNNFEDRFKNTCPFCGEKSINNPETAEIFCIKKCVASMRYNQVNRDGKINEERLLIEKEALEIKKRELELLEEKEWVWANYPNQCPYCDGPARFIRLGNGGQAINCYRGCGTSKEFDGRLRLHGYFG